MSISGGYSRRLSVLEALSVAEICRFRFRKYKYRATRKTRTEKTRETEMTMAKTWRWRCWEEEVGCGKRRAEMLAGNVGSAVKGGDGGGGGDEG